MANPRFPRPADQAGFRQITPTDISQFIRLDQCERYLRLRLHERASVAASCATTASTPQSIPPLLTRSGRALRGADRGGGPRRGSRASTSRPTTSAPAGWMDDNARVVDGRATSPRGAAVVLFQPRLRGRARRLAASAAMSTSCGWSATADGTLHVLIADMKSSTSAKVEHRLQVAFYHAMLAALFADAGIAYAQHRPGDPVSRPG